MYTAQETSHQDDDIENTLAPSEDDNLISTTAHLNVESMDKDWMDKSAEELSKHVSLDGPKTEYQAERETLQKTEDKMTRHWMERIDDMDPNLSKDMTSEYLNVQKRAA